MRSVKSSSPAMEYIYTRGICLLLLSIFHTVSAATVCSINVATVYAADSKVETSNTPYDTQAMSEAVCRESCTSTDGCQFMWWASDGVCRLYDPQASGYRADQAGHFALVKLCGECYEVFDRFNNSAVNTTSYLQTAEPKTELTCIELCAGTTNCIAAVLENTVCQLVENGVDTTNLIPSEGSITYKQRCSSTEPTTQASNVEPSTQVIQIELSTQPSDSVLSTQSNDIGTSTQLDGPDSSTQTNHVESSTQLDGPDSSTQTNHAESSTQPSFLGSPTQLGNSEPTTRINGSSTQTNATEGLLDLSSTFSTADSGGTTTWTTVTTGMMTSLQTTKPDTLFQGTTASFNGQIDISVTCPEPVLPPYTALSGARRYYVGSLVTVSCLRLGYQFPEGGTHRTLICLSNGEWHVNITRGCVETAFCKNSADPETKYPVETILDTTCPAGLRGPSGLALTHVVCLIKGQWFGIEGNCTADRCIPLPLFENATVDMALSSGLTDLNSRVTVVCRKGYRFHDGTTSKVIQCLSGGVWSNATDCLIEVCPSLSRLQNVTLNTTRSVYGTMVTVTCIPGYTFHDHLTVKTTTCLGFDGWNPNVTGCIPITCPAPDDVLNASRDSNDTYYLADVTYYCDGHLRFEDGHRNKTVTCVGIGHWSETNISCSTDRCPPIPSLQTAVANTTQAVQGTAVTYSCNPGYILHNIGDPNQTIICNNGVWHGIDLLSECNEINCSSPAVSNGYVSSGTNGDVPVGSRDNVTCYAGYFFPDGLATKEIECLPTGNWSVNDSCEPIDCGPPPMIPYTGMVIDGSTKYGDEVVYNCLDGYWFSYKMYSCSIRCQADGTWSDTPPACTAIQCPVLSLYGEFLISSADVSLHAVVNISCDNASRDPEAVVTATCLSSGEWSPPPPTCDGGQPEQYVPEPEEAAHSKVVGTVILSTISVISGAVLLSDVRRLYRHVLGDFSNR